MSSRRTPPPAPSPAAARAASPELPEEHPRAPSAPSSELRGLRAGCYLLQLTLTTPAGAAPVRYDGTLRVELRDESAIASGDLYLHGPSGASAGSELTEADPGAGIPIFPRDRYRYYVQGTELLDGLDDHVSLGFELHRYDHATNAWSDEGGFSADLRRTAAPPGYPSPDDFLRGEVVDASGAPAGQVAIGWVSPHLRRAVIEVDRVPDCEPPVANAAGADWRSIFEQVGWDLTVVESDADLPEPSGESWSAAEMHAAMLERRDSADLDSEWRYWILCVRSVDGDEARGIMFDRDGADSNNIPREAAGIASHWTIPDDDGWGLVKGMRFGLATDPYFRTAVHEIGHAMGLYHNTADNGFMSTTDVISRSVVAPQRFPENILWSHSPKDQRRLRHMPDLWVRPGGVPFGASYGTAPIVSDDAILPLEGLRLEVTPLLAAVPIGAPVRIAIALRNDDTKAVPAPTDISLKTGHASGSVTDPSGAVRSFRSFVRCTERSMTELAPGEKRLGSMTLLRGAEGALFPVAGEYALHARLDWDIDGVPVRVDGEATVTVLPAVDQAHAEAALQILESPDAVITLAVGGDHLDEGIAAIGAALANDVLRPHFAYVEAKRLASPFQQRAPDLAAAADLIDADTVMSPAELDKGARVLEAAAGHGEAPPEQLVAELRRRAEDVGARGAAETLSRL